MASVQVFGSPASTEVARVLACLFEKEVEFQLIRTDTYRGKQRRPDYLKLQYSAWYHGIAYRQEITVQVLKERRGRGKSF